MDVYSSPSRRASSWARSITRLARGVEVQRAALDPGAAREDRGDLAAERAEVHAEPPERLGGDPVVGLDERGEQVLGVEHGALHPLGELLGGDDGLLGLLGEAVELHGSVLVRWWCGGSVGGPGIGLVGEVEEGPGRRRAPRRRARCGSTTRTFTYRSPAPSPFSRGMPCPVSRNVRPFWVPAGIVSRTRPLSVVDRDLRRPAAPRAA